MVDGMPQMFWQQKRLSEMNDVEWEMICDGCGLCCLHKIRDADTKEVFYTSVACRLLGLPACRCLDYANRVERVPDCLVLSPEKLSNFGWLPKTCAYRLLWEGKELLWWHPLVSGDPETVHHAGISVRHKAISENFVNLDDIFAYVVDADIY